MKKLGFIMLFLCSVLKSLGGSMMISGHVNTETGKGIPFVNIAIEGTTYGTISNMEGRFSLLLPNNCIGRSITFSCIGYSSVKRKVGRVNKWKIIMKQQTEQIDEIVVIPDDTLKQIMRKAYERIGTNYSDKRSLTRGFYRTSLKMNDTLYLYLAENLINTFKQPYGKSRKGQVSLLKSRRYIHKQLPDLFPISLYGGLHIAVWNDWVYDTESFLLPRNYFKYNFIVNGTTKIDDAKAYEIVVTPKEGEKGWQTKFYLDCETLAFIQFERIILEKENQRRSRELGNGITFKERRYKIIYQKIDGRYFLKYIFDDETLEVNNNIFHQTDEYLTTSVDFTDIHPIVYAQQVSETDVPIHLADPYIESRWSNINTITADTKFEQQLTISIDSTRTVFEHTKGEKATSNILDKLHGIIGDYGAVIGNIKRRSGTYSLRIPNSDLTASSSLNSRVVFAGLALRFAYELTPHFQPWISYAAASSNTEFSSTGIGISYRMPIKNYGRQIFTEFDLGIASRSLFYLVERIDNDQGHLYVNNKKFEASKLKVYIGDQSIDFIPKLRCYTNLNGVVNVYIQATYSHSLWNKAKVKIQEDKKSFFGGKSITTNLNTFSPTRDGELLEGSGSKLNFFHAQVGVRIRF